MCKKVVDYILDYIQNRVIVLLETQEKTESKNPKISKTGKGRIMLLLKYVVCDDKK